jgi:hypothetical protein
MAFYGFKFSVVFLSSAAASPAPAGRNWTGGGTACRSHLHGLCRNPPQASIEAKMPQLLSGPILALSLVKLQLPCNHFQQTIALALGHGHSSRHSQTSGDRSSSCAHQNMRRLQVPDTCTGVNWTPFTPLLWRVTFRVSVFSVQACFHRLLVSSGETSSRHAFHPVSAVGSG